VYQSPTGGSWDLYITNADGTGQHQLTTAPGIEGLPHWSPDGQWIAYVSFDGRNWSLRIVNADGSDDRLVFTYDGGIYALPKADEPYGVRNWLDEQISWSQ
jgi:Tol biopolymer transport system component